MCVFIKSLQTWINSIFHVGSIFEIDMIHFNLVTKKGMKNYGGLIEGKGFVESIVKDNEYFDSPNSYVNGEFDRKESHMVIVSKHCKTIVNSNTILC